MAFDVKILPDYNGWTKEDWINFHRYLKNRYGRVDANDIWSRFFNNKPIGWTRDAVYTADPEFKKYFGSQGITFDPNFYSQLDRIGGFLSAIPSGVKTAGIVIAVVGGVVVVSFIGYNIYNGIKKLSALKKQTSDPEFLAKAAKLALL